MPKIQWDFFKCNPPFQNPAYGPAYYLFVALTGSIVALQSPPLCARASGEEELEEEKDEMRKMSWTFSGERKGIIVFCIGALLRRQFYSPNFHSVER